MPDNNLTRLLALEGYQVHGLLEEDATSVTLFVSPTAKHAVCSGCGQGCLWIHSTEERTVRHLDAFGRKCFLNFAVRFVDCRNCGVRVERHLLAEPRKRSTKAFRRYVGELCRILPISEVAEHVDLSEDTVRRIDKEYLATYPAPDFKRLRRIAVDEIAYRKGHRYLTLVLDYDTGEVVWSGKGKGEDTLKAFFDLVGSEVCKQIVAASMDMSKAYCAAVRDRCPNARVVFDHFHVKMHLNNAVNDTRKLAMANATAEQKRTVKGQRFLLLRNYADLPEEKHGRLEELLALNESIQSAYLLKEQFDLFWMIPNAGGAARFLDRWVRDALETEIPPVMRVARMIKRHRDGLLAYHTHGMTNGPLEGLNTKINVLRRSRYGFTDLDYFGLKIRQLSIERSRRHKARREAQAKKEAA